MTGVEFGELPAVPPHGRLGGTWIPIFDVLRARPGEWAKVRTAPSVGAARHTVFSIKHGTYKGAVSGEFDAAARDCDVWACYVGGAS